MRIAVATKVIDYFEHKQQQKKTENEQLNLPSFKAQSQHSSTNNGTEQNSEKSPPTSRRIPFAVWNTVLRCYCCIRWAMFNTWNNFNSPCNGTNEVKWRKCGGFTHILIKQFWVRMQFLFSPVFWFFCCIFPDGYYETLVGVLMAWVG